MNSTRKKCPECDCEELYSVTARSKAASFLLPGLSRFFLFARFQVVVCSDCGHTRFFVPEDDLAKLSEAKQWRRI